MLNLNGAYTYSPTYANVLAAYNASSSTPTYLEEANYEQETDGNSDGCESSNDPLICPRTGMVDRDQRRNRRTLRMPLHLRHDLARIPDSSIDTPGVTMLQTQANFLQSIGEWYNLAPDQTSSLVTSVSGGNKPHHRKRGKRQLRHRRRNTRQNPRARLPTPRRHTTVNLTKMNGTTTARWFDPTNGTYTTITGSPFPNTTTHTFTTPTNNSQNQPDWILLLQAN